MIQSSNITVLVIGKFYTEAFALHIAETLEAMGHKVVRFAPGVKYKTDGSLIAKRWTQVKSTLHELSKQFLVSQWRETKKLLTLAERQSIDLTIVCHDFLLPAQVSVLKRTTNSPVVMWFPDAITNFNKSFFLNSDYDTLFFKDPYLVYRLNQTLCRAIYYLPECCSSTRHKPCELSPQDLEIYGCDIATAGNLYPYRAAFFSQLREYEVKIWGNPPPLWMDVSLIEPMFQNKYVANEEKSKAFRAAKVVINSLHPAEVWGINARAFEIAGAGGFQMLDWRPGIEQLFREDEELVTFSNLQELKDKLRYYLPREYERRKIAQRAQERAHLEHTYNKRLELLLETVFNGARGFAMPKIPNSMQRTLERV